MKHSSGRRVKCAGSHLVTDTETKTINLKSCSISGGPNLGNPRTLHIPSPGLSTSSIGSLFLSNSSASSYLGPGTISLSRCPTGPETTPPCYLQFFCRPSAHLNREVRSWCCLGNQKHAPIPLEAAPNFSRRHSRRRITY